MFNEPTARRPIARSRSAQKEATAKIVLEAARAEFERVGFEAANIRAIAARAKVAPGTVIHHHGDKRELLYAALFEDLETTVREAIASLGPPPLEKQLVKLTSHVFRYYEKRPVLSRTLLKESLFAEPPWAARFNGQVALVHAAIAKLATDARACGELDASIDPALLGVTYFSFFYFALIAWVQGGHDKPVALVQHLLQQHLKSPARRKRSSR